MKNLRLTLYLFWGSVLMLLFLATPALAATNIVADGVNCAGTPDSGDNYCQWAWNDTIGWIDFRFGGGAGNVTVKSNIIEGYASSPLGYLALDCATGPSGSSCSPVSYNVANNGSGVLSGWAWAEGFGWVSFNCSNLSTCATSNYSVTIDSDGNFLGYAWNDVIGWISFSCVNTATCGTVNYRVKTTAGTSSGAKTGYAISSVYDFGVDGATVNSVMWRGSSPNGTSVKFEMASSSALTGPWNFQGSGSSVPANTLLETRGFHNMRYLRYKVIVTTDNWQTSPRVDDVIMNYSL